MNLIISPQNRAQFHPLEAECCRSTCSCTVVTRQRSYSETTGRCLWNVSVEVRFCVRWEKRVDAQIHCFVFTSRCNMLAVSCSGLWNRLLWVVLRVVVSFLQSGNGLCGVFTVRGTAERRSHTELHVWRESCFTHVLTRARLWLSAEQQTCLLGRCVTN